MRAVNRFWRASILGLAISLLVANSAYSKSTNENDWPKWRGQNYDGKALATDVFKEGYGLKVAWKKPLGSGYSSISIADGRAITAFSDSTWDFAISFDVETGEELWRYKIDSTYVGHNGSHDGQISTPFIDGDKVFIYARKGQLLALDTKTGRKIWSHDIKAEMNSLEPFHGFGSSPIVVGDVLFCQVGVPDERTVCGFDKKSGEVLWSAASDTVNYQSPIYTTLAGEEQIIAVGDKVIYGLRPKTGVILWQYRHNGGNQGINPVVVDGDKILLNHAFGSSMMVKVTKSGNDYEVEKLWENRNIRNTYNTTVAHDGHLYGYSGRFLTCLNAETGETVWKSRPPGNGFLILVDDHLVILTQNGTMHVAEVSTEGYEEVAATKVFDGTTWSPPSFAYGSIFARNLHEIARVDIARVDEVIAADTKREVQGVLRNSKFAAFVKDVESASNKKAMVDEFMAEQKQFPIIEGDDMVHIVYRGDVKDVAISGDFMDVGSDYPMNRVSGTDLYYYSTKLTPDAVVGYQIAVDFNRPGADPLNDRKATSFNGENAVIYMPESDDHSHLNDPVGVTTGRIDSFQFESKIMGVSRKIEVYLPSGYDNSSNRYPVLYVNYGQQARNWGKLTNTLDNLIGETISPVIAVFIHLSQNGFNEVSGQLRESYAQMIAEELVPHIDEKYRTLTDAESRAITGASAGGFISAVTAFRHPGIFGKVGGQSANIDAPRDKELSDLVSNSEKLPVEFFFAWGKYDIRNSNLDRAAVNRTFAELLEKKGYVNHGGEFNEGYGFASWNTRSDDLLEAFFPLKKTQK